MTITLASQHISVQGLHIYHGKKAVVHDVSFDFRLGEVIGVLGANGAGKSSLLRALAGDEPQYHGEITLNGSPLLHIGVTQLAKVRAVMPQSSGVTFGLTVEEVIRMGAYPFSQASVEMVKRWMNQALDDADIQHLRKTVCSDLSGGELQRVHFARVLVQLRAIVTYEGHAWLLLDEPTSSLDPMHQHMLMNKICSIAKNENIGVMVILHDLNLAAYFCDRAMLLKKGRIIADEVPSIAFSSETLKTCFDMQMHVVPHPFCPGKSIVLPAL